MMTKKCPHCQNSIEVSDLWELFDCPSCRSSLKMEGEEIKLVQEPDAHVNEVEVDKVSQNEVYENNDFEHSQENEELSSEGLHTEASLNHLNPPSEQESFINDSLQNNEENLSSGDESPDSLENSQEGFTKVKSQFEEEFDSLSEKDTHVHNSNENENEVVQNLDQNLKILYDLEVKVSQDNLVKVRQVLLDKRLNLNVEELMSQIQEDDLRIENLNPVQVLYLVRQLSQLPVQVTWVQKTPKPNS